MHWLCGDAVCFRTSQCNGSSDRPGVGKGGSETCAAHAVKFWPRRSSEPVSYTNAGACSPTVVPCYTKADELQLFSASISSGKCNVCLLACHGEDFVIRTNIIDIIRAGDIVWDWKCFCKMRTRFMAENVVELPGINWGHCITRDLGGLGREGVNGLWTAQYIIVGECERMSCGLNWAVTLVKCHQVAWLCLLRMCVWCVCL
jgi:hypothetical protein